MSETGSVKDFSIELVKEFCEEHYDIFAEWLDTVKEIEASEADLILARLGR